MASKGQVVVNSATGERVVFQVLARESGGELLRFDIFFASGGSAKGAHVHPHQEERFEIVTGTMGFQVGRATRLAGAGEVIVVPPGTPHLPRNVGETEAHCIAEFRPALNIETFFENAFALLSARGPRTALPMIFELSELLSHYGPEIRATPPPVQWAVAVAAPIGRALGYRPRFRIEAQD
jgi:mannose-6-phosphate isomerase-like protein (cupin superfamily)